MSEQDLLIEIGTEELPPKALRRLSEAFGQGVEQGLQAAGLAPKAVQCYATPRRLAVLVQGVASAQADQRNERRGPALTAAFDDKGIPTPAAQGFARSCGVSVEALQTQKTDKGAWLCYTVEQPGESAQVLIPPIIETALAALPIPKRMRWGAGEAEFVRPVHWVVLLFGEAVIDCTILAVQTGRETRGHRFMAPQALPIDVPAHYAQILEQQGRVMADFALRREAIVEQIKSMAKTLKQARAQIDEDLLDEVTALVEWPSAVLGGFEPKYLQVPQEVLISTMKDNQKYFPLIGNNGALLAHFITISNIQSRDVAKVREGNERVIRPRFADAAFFWGQDKKHSLESRLEGLKTVVFEKKLGSLWDKTQRIGVLVGPIAQALAADPAQAQRAALLCKCDLISDMVFEFPELQGIMGRYYAQHDGEAAPVAQALDEQYMPRHAGDALPRGAIGAVLSLADKIDTLVGIFATGRKPSGTKDPYGLRRAALGVLRILIEGEHALDLKQTLQDSANCFEKTIGADAVVDDVFAYIMDRLRAYYADLSIDVDVVDAVMAQLPVRALDFHQRVLAVQAFRQLPQAQSLAAANKRIGNILKQYEGEPPASIDKKLLREVSEQALAKQLNALRPKALALFDAGDYGAALKLLAGLRDAVDAFFDQVMVMDEDVALKNNRIALLGQLRALFLRVADLSRLQA